MTATPDLATIDPALMKLVRIKSARLAGTYGFNRSDRDDICQELLLDCWIRLRQFDPGKSSRRSFLRRVVGHRIATLLDAQRAACRDYRMCRDSLDAPVQFASGESIDLGETVSSDEYESRLGRSGLSSRDRVDHRIDIATVIASLPADLAAIADMLKSVGAVEAALLLNVPRATFYRRLADIRRAFGRAGLNLYLGRSCPASTNRRHK